MQLLACWACFSLFLSLSQLHFKSSPSSSSLSPKALAPESCPQRFLFLLTFFFLFFSIFNPLKLSPLSLPPPFLHFSQILIFSKFSSYSSFISHLLHIFKSPSDSLLFLLLCLSFSPSHMLFFPRSFSFLYCIVLYCNGNDTKLVMCIGKTQYTGIL